MPAYNEEATIGDVVVGWDDAFGALGVSCELRVYDDGSRDATGTLLEQVACERPHVVAVRQANVGHGPTILRGYHEARGEWVFQVDSDDEMRPDAFPVLWARRDGADLVLGYRTGRNAAVTRPNGSTSLIAASTASTAGAVFRSAAWRCSAACRPPITGIRRQVSEPPRTGCEPLQVIQIIVVRRW